MVRLFSRENDRLAPAEMVDAYNQAAAIVKRAEATTIASGQAATAGAVAPPSPDRGGRYDYSFPVELDRGGKLTIEWNHGDDPDEVAQRFLMTHKLGADNKPDIVQFITTAQRSQPAAGSGNTLAAPSEAEKSRMTQQLVLMGFDEGRVRAALDRAGWNVQVAAGFLLTT